MKTKKHFQVCFFRYTTINKRFDFEMVKFGKIEIDAKKQIKDKAIIQRGKQIDQPEPGENGERL